jgi:hypothetical protein
MKFPCIALLAVGLLAGVMVKAQTADEIVNKNIEAIGGKDKINSVKSLYVEADMDAMGNTAPSVTYIVNGKSFRNDLDFGGQKISRVVTTTGGWSVNPLAGQAAPEAMPVEQRAAQADEYQIGGFLFDYAARGYKIELQGKEDVNGVSAHKLHLTGPNGVDATYFIDPTTFLVLKMAYKLSIQGQTIEATRAYSKYQKTDAGIVIPFTTELAFQGFSLTSNVKKIEANKDVDAKLFDMPK